MEKDIAAAKYAKLSGIACAFFRQAQQEMEKRNFPAASALMEKYSAISKDLDFPATDNRDSEVPDVSVVIVAYNTGKLLIDCIKSVFANTDRNFEIVVVDNGGNEAVHEVLHQLPILHLVMPDNLILSEGRNIGARYSRGRIVALLDDDAVVPADYISSIRRGFSDSRVMAFRGKVLPKTESPNNRHAKHYDLGSSPMPSLIDTEGNSAFLREVFLEFGGMDPLLFGHEGTELGYWIQCKYGGNPLWYWPETRIFHDFAYSDDKLEVKTRRHETMTRYLFYKHKEIGNYLGIYGAIREQGLQKNR